MLRQWMLMISLITGVLISPVQSKELSHPDAGTLFIYPERISLENGEFTTADRGMLYVPLNRSDAESKIIGIEIYRFKSISMNEAPVAPIFLLNGGPGFPGLSGPLQKPGFYEDRILPFIQIADLVVVGQRGIGSSVPNTQCKSPEAFQLDRDTSDEEVDESWREASRQCKAYWQEQGLDLKGFTVIEAARDVDDVRKALDYDTITIVGGSFGSHWGMTIMRYLPDIVERAVLTGMEGPDHTYDMPTGVLNSLSRMAEAAEKSPGLEKLIPEGGLISAWESVITHLQTQPEKVSITHAESGETQNVLFNAQNIRRLALGYSNRASSRNGMRTWPLDVLTLYGGDFTKAAELAIQNQGQSDFPTASYFMLDCGSGISAEREAVLNNDPAAKIVGQLGRWYQINCPIWGSDLGDDFRTNFNTEIPTLIVHGTWDVSTPLENALELAPNFNNSKLVLVNGGSHGALGEALNMDDSFRKAMTNFLKTGDMSSVPGEVNLPPLEWVLPER